MGLDFVNITMRVEKTFHVELSSDDLVGLTRDNDISTGDLYELLLKKLDLPGGGRYDYDLNFRLWAQMRQVLQSVTLVPSDRIQFQTRLDELIPRETRRQTWDALREKCPYRIPELDYPRIVRMLGLLVAAAVVLIEQAQLWQIQLKWLWPALGVFGLWMFGETYLKLLTICAPLRTEIPAHVKTAKELCRTVLANNYTEICEGMSRPVDPRSLSVWEQLVDILSDELGVQRDRVTFRSRLIHDLGMA